MSGRPERQGAQSGIAMNGCRFSALLEFLDDRFVATQHLKISEAHLCRTDITDSACITFIKQQRGVKNHNVDIR
jgi:hypothetical protein